jgi:HPt (histidine-containing phosphotransfer) domain-containing protein
MLLQNSLAQGGCDLFIAPTLIEFFSHWHVATAGFSFMAINDLESVLALFPNYWRQPLTPLFLITDTSNFKTYSEFAQLAYDFIASPMTSENLQDLQEVWSAKPNLLDQSMLAKLVSSTSPELGKKIVESFRQSVQEAQVNTMQFLTQNQSSEAAKASHAVKASAQLVGAPALFHLCRWLDIKSRCQSPISTQFLLQTEFIYAETQKAFQNISHPIS